MSVVLTYYGHSCFGIKNGDARLLIDPFLTGNPRAAVAADQAEADYLLVSHAHGDHLGDAIAIAKRTGATIVANFEIASHCMKAGCEAHALHIGGGWNFPFGRVKLTIAHHGSSFADGSYGGNPAGFLITIEGKTIYHACDTGLFYDMKLIGEEGVDVAILPIGDNFTMGPARRPAGRQAHRAALRHPGPLRYLRPHPAGSPGIRRRRCRPRPAPGAWS